MKRLLLLYMLFFLFYASSSCKKDDIFSKDDAGLYIGSYARGDEPGADRPEVKKLEKNSIHLEFFSCSNNTGWNHTFLQQLNIRSDLYKS